MDYKIVKSSKKDVDKLKEYNRRTIFEYANNLSKEEIEEINNYVDKTVPEDLDSYYNIIINDKVIGCFLMFKEKDGILLDELYLEEEYRNLGIGTSIISKVIKENDIVYLWVYKKNKKAIKLYKRLGFIVIDETETRYYMKNSK